MITMDNENPTIIDPVSSWNHEYSRQGIPSSYREDPSGVLVWALSNFPFLSTTKLSSGLDIGCGTGRNTVALADAGMAASGIDFSSTALEVARSRTGAERVNFIEGDVTRTLPFNDNSFDFAADVFVYFHQLANVDRSDYRREIHRVLRPGGFLLVSLATDQDGYYSNCPTGPVAGIDSSVRLAWDPVAEVGNILLTYEEFIAEFSELFFMQMSWVKRKTGRMHGSEHMRETAAIIFSAR